MTINSTFGTDKITVIPKFKVRHISADLAGDVYTPPPHLAKDQFLPCPKGEMRVCMVPLAEQHECKMFFGDDEIGTHYQPPKRKAESVSEVDCKKECRESLNN